MNKELFETINDFLDNIESGNNIEAEKMFNTLLQDRIDSMLDRKKIEVAQSMFNTENCEDCDTVEEELSGDQKEIDLNKNNKIDAQDFKMLRKKKSKKKESQVAVEPKVNEE